MHPEDYCLYLNTIFKNEYCSTVLGNRGWERDSRKFICLPFRTEDLMNDAVGSPFGGGEFAGGEAGK